MTSGVIILTLSGSQMDPNKLTAKFSSETTNEKLYIDLPKENIRQCEKML